MSRGLYRLTEVTLVDGEYAEPNVNEHGTLLVALDPAAVTVNVAEEVTLHAETVKVIGTVNLSAASITALADAIVAAMTP